MRRYLWISALLLVQGGLAVRPSLAYVRELTNDGVAVAWRSPCVTMHFYLGDTPPVLTADDYWIAGQRAAAAWSYPTLACTDLRLTLVAEPQAAADVGYDRKNVLLFRQGSWCSLPGHKNDAGVMEPDCHPGSALAITSMFKNKRTGEILDTDIEFNAVDYTWGDMVDKPSLQTIGTTDFQNALTHELGHVIGLDHNCFTPADMEARQVDNTGALEVDCYSPDLLDSVALATMYPSVVLSDTERRTLSPDDQLGACEVYPYAHETCPAASDGGCSVATAGEPPSTRTPYLVISLAFACALLSIRWISRKANRNREPTSG